MTHEEHTQREALTLRDIAIAIEDGRLPCHIDGADYVMKVSDLRLLRRDTRASTRIMDDLGQRRPHDSPEQHVDDLGLDPSGF